MKHRLSVSGLTLSLVRGLARLALDRRQLVAIWLDLFPMQVPTLQSKTLQIGLTTDCLLSSRALIINRLAMSYRSLVPL